MRRDISKAFSLNILFIYEKISLKCILFAYPNNAFAFLSPEWLLGTRGDFFNINRPLHQECPQTVEGQDLGLRWCAQEWVYFFNSFLAFEGITKDITKDKCLNVHKHNYNYLCLHDDQLSPSLNGKKCGYRIKTFGYSHNGCLINI